MTDNREHEIAYHMNKIIGYEIEKEMHITELGRLGIEIMYSDGERVGYFDNQESDYKIFYKKV